MVVRASKKAAAKKRAVPAKKAARPAAKKARSTSSTTKAVAKQGKAAYRYACTVFSQRSGPAAPLFCIFAASAGDILSWADIERLGPGVKGVQRRENVAKRRQIRTFLEEKGNTIPSAVIIALDGIDADVGDSTLSIPTPAKGPKPGLVIDGQHRLLGIRDFNADALVPVVAILNATDVEKAFQFLVVNNKGSRVSQDHIKALALNYREKALFDRLVHAKLALDNERLTQVGIINSSKSSPFRNRVKFPTTRGDLKKIVPEAFEKALQYIEASRLPKLDDPDVQREFFLAIWSSIIAKWGQEEVFAAGNRLTEKVGIITMSRYLVDRLASLADNDTFDLDLSSFDDVQKEVVKLLKRQPIDFWRDPWVGSGYDTAIGHAKVLDALRQIHRNLRATREWSEDVAVLSRE